MSSSSRRSERNDTDNNKRDECDFASFIGSFFIKINPYYSTGVLVVGQRIGLMHMNNVKKDVWILLLLLCEDRIRHSGGGAFFNNTK